MKTLKTKPQAEPFSLTSHLFTILMVFPMQLLISSFIQPIGKSCRLTQNDSFEKSSFETGVHLSKDLKDKREDSKSQGLLNITQCRYSQLSKVKIKVFEQISTTENRLDTLQIFNMEF